jgi:hypothetical protein
MYQFSLQKIVLKIISIIVFFSTSYIHAQTVNNGMWYHQQPTSINDTGIFYGGPKTFEGFCGPTAVGMALEYFIPNIHENLFEIYGEKKYHNDNRCGLKSSDPYCYNENTTYAFEDFLGHNYIGRHITETGCSYRELVSIIKGIEMEVRNYASKIMYIKRSQIKEYLDDGYLIVSNTNQGGGHYILIGGWDGSSEKPTEANLYIWDGWKVPLSLDSTQYIFTTNIVGNKFNRGSAKNILCYKISSGIFDKIFKDQLGDGTMLAFKMMPIDLPQVSSKMKNKGICASESVISKEGINIFIDSISSHGITDLFLSGKGIDWFISSKKLRQILPLAHKKSIKVHVSLMVLNDSTFSSIAGYTHSDNNWIDARDTVYRNYFLNHVIDQLCKFDIDGIHLDYLKYPGNAFNYSGGKEVITEYCRLIRKYMDKNGKAFASLSATIIPEGDLTTYLYGQNIFAMSKYLNFIIPSLFTHSYLKNPSWVGSQTEYLTKKVISGCNVWPGLQSIDDRGNFITSLELKQCTDYALASGSNCIVYFQYPLTNWQWEILDRYKK